MAYFISTQIWLPALMFLLMLGFLGIHVYLDNKFKNDIVNKKADKTEVKRVEDKFDGIIMTMKEAQDENNTMTKQIDTRVAEILEILNKGK